MNSADVKKWLSVAGSTFVGAVLAFMVAALQAGNWPTTTAALQSLALGAALAGASAVLHLLQTPPASNPVSAIKARLAKAVPPVALLLLGVVAGSANAACTKQQGQQVQTVATHVVSLLDVACVDALVVAPLLDPSLPPATLNDIRLGCKLVDVSDEVLNQIIGTFADQPKIAPRMLAYKRMRQAAGKW